MCRVVVLVIKPIAFLAFSLLLLSSLLMLPIAYVPGGGMPCIGGGTWSISLGLSQVDCSVLAL